MSNQTSQVEIEAINEDVENLSPRYKPGTVDNPFLFDADDPALQKFLLTIMFVAGKNAAVQDKKVDEFFARVKRDIGAFSVDALGIFDAIHASLSVTEMDSKINGWLKEIKVGQYTRLTAAIKSAATRIGNGVLDLENPSRPALNNTVGVGLKSASMFMLYTVKDWEGAVLDTHILKFIRDELGVQDAPMATPTKVADYARFENVYLEWAKTQGKSLSELDFEIWSRYRKRPA